MEDQLKIFRLEDNLNSFESSVEVSFTIPIINVRKQSSFLLEAVFKKSNFGRQPQIYQARRRPQVSLNHF